MAHSSPAEWGRPAVEIDRGGRFGVHYARKATVRGGSVAFWALMAFTFILLVEPQWYFPSLASLRVALLTGGVAIASCLIQRIIQRRRIVRLSREMKIIACLLGWAIVTVPFSYWPGGSFSFLVNFYLKTIAIFWLLGNVIHTPLRLRQMIWGLSLMTIPLALSGVKNYFSGMFLYNDPGRIVGYGVSLAANPNDLALVLNLILPLSVALFLLSRTGVARIVLLAIIGLTVLGVIVTFSRGGFLTLLTMVAVYGWKLRRRITPGVAIAAIVLVLVFSLMLPSSYVERMSIFTDTEGSSNARWIGVVGAVHFILKNPILGAGVGMDILAINEEMGLLWMEVHNVYLECAVDLGIPGLVLFLLLMVACMKSVAFVQQRCVGMPAFRELFYLAEGLHVSLITFAVAGMFYPVAYQFYFYYIAGLAAAAKNAYAAPFFELRSPSTEVSRI